MNRTDSYIILFSILFKEEISLLEVDDPYMKTFDLRARIFMQMIWIYHGPCAIEWVAFRKLKNSLGNVSDFVFMFLNFVFLNRDTLSRSSHVCIIGRFSTQNISEYVFLDKIMFFSIFTFSCFSVTYSQIITKKLGRSNGTRKDRESIDERILFREDIA